jgi:hypothetical protein
MSIFRADFSSQNGDRTTEQQRFVVRLFLWEKGLNVKDIHKEMFPVYGGKCLSRKAVQTRLTKSLKDVRKSQMMSGQVRKSLIQQSKDLLRGSKHC